MNANVIRETKRQDRYKNSGHDDRVRNVRHCSRVRRSTHDEDSDRGLSLPTPAWSSKQPHSALGPEAGCSGFNRAFRYPWMPCSILLNSSSWREGDGLALFLSFFLCFECVPETL